MWYIHHILQGCFTDTVSAQQSGKWSSRIWAQHHIETQNNANRVYNSYDMLYIGGIIFVWRRHENMSPYIGSKVNTNYERITSCVGCQ